MKAYTLYFELFGRKMKTVVHADNEWKAKEQLRNKIIFHKVEEKEVEGWEEIYEMLKNCELFK